MPPDRRAHLAACMIVRIARISQAQDALPLLESWLDPWERERAARFHFAEDRARFILGRGLLRKSLSYFLEQAPETIVLTLTDRDRPILPNDEEFQFSLTHSHDLVAVALTADARIGIDLEWMQNKSEIPELAQKILSEADFQAFQVLNEAEKVAAFFRIWTRKEAYLKATGEGITEVLPQISVSFGPEKTISINDVRAEADMRTWTLRALSVPTDYMGCIACDDVGKQLEYDFVHFDKGEIISDSPGDLS